MSKLLNQVLTESSLRKAAGSTFFERGEEYCDGGAVRALETKGDRITAQVKGTRTYRVQLFVESDRLAHGCTCPIGDEGAFCKHAVAVGLAWLAQGRGDDCGRKNQVSLDDVRGYLEKQDKKELVNLISDFAVQDARLFDRLALRAAQAGGPAHDLKRYRNALRKAIEIRDFVDWHSAYDYANKVEDAIATLRTLIAGHPKEVVDLAEYAWELLEEAQNLMDDSDGHLRGLLETLEEIHLEACRKAEIDPSDVAARLFRLEVDSGLGAFYDAPERYADVLGDEGMAAYEKLARGAWAKIPPLKPGDKEGRYEEHRFQITSILERLAKRSGNIDTLVDVMKRDLSGPMDFLKIIETYQNAGRHDDSLEWAERGARAFDGYEGDGLREALSWEYHRRGRDKEAMALAWRAFTDHPGLQSYRGLKTHADAIKKWPEWRDRALMTIRADIEESRKKSADRSGWGREADASALVEIFLWEKDTEAAWGEAKDGGCSESLWLALAQAREKAHPEDALPIYQRQLASTLRYADKNAYREAVKTLGTIKRVMTRMGQGKEFKDLVRQKRDDYRRRKNFIAMLDEAKLDRS